MEAYKITFTFFDGTTTERIFYGDAQAARAYADAEGEPDKIDSLGRPRRGRRPRRPVIADARVEPCEAATGSENDNLTSAAPRGIQARD